MLTLALTDLHVWFTGNAQTPWSTSRADAQTSSDVREVYRWAKKLEANAVGNEPVCWTFLHAEIVGMVDEPPVKTPKNARKLRLLTTLPVEW